MTRTASKNGYNKKDDKSNQRNNNNNKSNNKTDGRGNNKKNDSNRNNYHPRNNQGSNNKREDGPGFAEKEYGLTYEKLKDNSSNDLNVANKKHSYNSNAPPAQPPILQRRRSSAPELPFFFEQLSTEGGMINSPNPINPINTSIANTPVATTPANLNFNLINAAATASNATTPNFANFPLNLNGLNGLNLLNGFNLLNGLNSFASPTTATSTPTTVNPPLPHINTAVANTNSNASANISNDNSKSNNNSTINGHGGRFNHLYAGPTFSNSPAASSLPMPNFININRNNTDTDNGADSSSRLSRSFAEEYMKLPNQLYSSAEINNELSKNYVPDDLVLYSKKDLYNNQNNGINNFNKEDLFMRRDISAINTQNIVSGLSGLRNASTPTPSNKRNSYAEEVFAMDDESTNASNTPNLPLANGMPASSSSPTKTKFKSQEDENLKRKSMELLQYLSSSVAGNSANTNNNSSNNNDEAQKIPPKPNGNQTSAVSSIKIRSYNNSSTSSTSSSYTNTNTTLINSNEDNSMFSTTPNSFYNKNMNSTLAPVISATTDVLSSSENSNSTLSLEQISQNLKNMLKIN